MAPDGSEEMGSGRRNRGVEDQGRWQETCSEGGHKGNLPTESLHLGSLEGWSFKTISLRPHTARSHGVFKRPLNDSGGKFALHESKAAS